MDGETATGATGEGVRSIDANRESQRAGFHPLPPPRASALRLDQFFTANGWSRLGWGCVNQAAPSWVT
jgi:hypothetical protein